MRIALVIERAYPRLGGAETSVLELSAALRSTGLEVDIIAAKGEQGARHTHLLCQDVPTKRVGLEQFGDAISEFLSKNQYDIIHSVLPFSFADIYQPRGGTYPEAIARNIASYSNRYTRAYKKLTVFANQQRNALAKAEQLICNSPAGPIVAALSNYVARHFKNHYAIADNRLVVIRNGVLTDKTPNFSKTERFRSQIMVQLKLKEADRPVFFLFVANNFRLKGLEFLIRAMQMTVASNPEQIPILIVAGSGKVKPYKQLAEKLNVAWKIAFLDYIRDIRSVLEFSDVAVLPTFYDPSSRFILEALAADKPVITTKFNGTVEMFANNRHGKIIDMPENISALAEAIGYFTNIENIQKAATAILTDNLREQISVSRVAKELKPLYESVLERRCR
ncbi:MAG: glycosyltransferase family 4 protein [Phycisphaerales bacterium]|jgi:glycosyltransferase involved in cell wall biosynthesis